MRRNLVRSLLFNLLKKPDANQRAALVKAFVELSARIGSERTQDEIVTQCWEEVREGVG